MYHIYDTLDELVILVEQARGVPMSASALLPRDHVLELLDELRDRMPEEVNQAKAVLDQRGELLHAAQIESDQISVRASAEADAAIARARAEAEQLRAAAQDHHEQFVAAGEREYQRLTREGAQIRDELLAEAQHDHDGLIAHGRAERDRLISASEIYSSAIARADEIGAATAAETEAMRREVDGYIDAKLAEFEATLAHLLRSVDHARANVAARIHGDYGVGAAPLE